MRPNSRPGTFGIEADASIAAIVVWCPKYRRLNGKKTPIREGSTPTQKLRSGVGVHLPHPDRSQDDTSETDQECASHRETTGPVGGWYWPDVWLCDLCTSLPEATLTATHVPQRGATSRSSIRCQGGHWSTPLRCPLLPLSTTTPYYHPTPKWPPFDGKGRNSDEY